MSKFDEYSLDLGTQCILQTYCGYLLTCFDPCGGGPITYTVYDRNWKPIEKVKIGTGKYSGKQDRRVQEWWGVICRKRTTDLFGTGKVGMLLCHILDELLMDFSHPFFPFNWELVKGDALTGDFLSWELIDGRHLFFPVDDIDKVHELVDVIKKDFYCDYLEV